MMNAIRYCVVCLATLLTLTVSAVAANIPLSHSQIDALDKLIASHPDDFSGISVDEDHGKIIVRHARSRDKLAIGKLLATLGTPHASDKERAWTVELQAATRSQRELETVFSRIQKAEPWASTARPVLVGWEIDVENNVVAVNVTEISPELVRIANRTFGSAVELRLTARENSGYSRSNDYAPWYGGIPVVGLIPDAWASNQLGKCTASFSVSDSVGFFTGLLTAGHCFGDAAGITQSSDKERVGMIIAREKNNNGLDYALIGWGPNDRLFGTGTGYGTSVWVSETSASPIVSANVLVSAPQIGTVVCFDGAVTGERCNARITSMSSCQILDDPFSATCKLVIVSSTNGQRIANHGDSGGPVYTKILGSIVPAGIIIGGNKDGTIAYYHKLSTVLSALADSPNVGGYSWHVIRP